MFELNLNILYVLLQDPEYYVLKEDASPCIFGPIEKQRWSYACAKQLIERLVYGRLTICLVWILLDL